MTPPRQGERDVTAGYDIGLATEGDFEGILNLQDRNQPDRGGTLSARFSRAWFEAAAAAMPVVVARREGRVVGYLVSSPVSAYADVPVVQAMLAAYSGMPGAYVYGPICIEETERGRGLAGAMFAELRAQLPGQEGVLFIRRNNAASLKAHVRMGMREVAEFTHGGTAFVVLSYIG
jgi:L-amino acid N-acyltransferase YncA